MAQIGSIKLRTGSGTVDLPVFSLGDSGANVYEILRVSTSSGTGFVPLTSTSNAYYSYLRVKTQNHNVLGFHDSPNVGVTSGLVLRYRFENGSGSTAEDSAGGNDGSINGASWSSSSKVGSYCLDFDGGNDYVETGLSHTNSSYTLCAWVNIDNTDTGNSRTSIISADDQNGNTSIAHSDNSGVYAVARNGGSDNKTAEYSISSNNWYFIVGRFDSSNNNVSMWVDGDKKDTINSGWRASSNSFRIGDSPPYPNQWDGRIDEVRIYDRALSASEIQQIYDATR